MLLPHRRNWDQPGFEPESFKFQLKDNFYYQLSHRMGKTLSVQLFSRKKKFLVGISIAHAGTSCVLLTAIVPPPTPPPSSFLLLPQVERFGKPTWRRLVKAVEDKVGGNNCALAQTIARDHPGAPGNHIFNLQLSTLPYSVSQQLLCLYIAHSQAPPSFYLFSVQLRPGSGYFTCISVPSILQCGHTHIRFLQ